MTDSGPGEAGGGATSAAIKWAALTLITLILLAILAAAAEGLLRLRQ